MSPHSGPHRRRRPLGAHMSIAGGVANAVKRAVDVEATALQIFTKNQRRWNGKPLEDEDVAAFRASYERSSLQYLCAHVSYLINLASPDAEVRRKSVEALLDEVQRADRLGCDCVVMHPGSPKSDPRDLGISRIADGMRKVLESTSDSNVRLALENTAGQGTRIGATIEDLADILDRVDRHPRVAMCLDTCHALAAGVEWRVREETSRLAREIERQFGLDRLAVIHINDSKAPLRSHRDLHEHIGKGYVGLEGFHNLFSEQRFRGIPGVLETPKDEKTLAEDRQNLGLLREIETHCLRRQRRKKRVGERVVHTSRTRLAHRMRVYDRLS